MYYNTNKSYYVIYKLKLDSSAIVFITLENDNLIVSTKSCKVTILNMSNFEEKIKEISKQKMTCECGSVFRQGEKTRHYKTIKHKAFIEQQNNL